jgi:hypothetical protein
MTHKRFTPILAIMQLSLMACSFEASEASNFIEQNTRNTKELICGWVLTDVMYRTSMPGPCLRWEASNPAMLLPHGAATWEIGTSSACSIDSSGSTVMVTPQADAVDVYGPIGNGVDSLSHLVTITSVDEGCF